MKALSSGKTLFLFLFPAIVLPVWYLFPRAIESKIKPGEPAIGLTRTAGELDGHALFLQHCAYCHGENGRGNGPAELTIKARAFGWDKFKFATTMNGVPTDENLLAILKRGIPGSAMPAFGNLPEEQLKLLVGYVKSLDYSGLYGRIEAKMLKDDELDPISLHQQVAKLSTPGDPLPIPAIHEATTESIENGKKIYLASCANCHGPKGLGDGTQEMKDDDGKPTRPRDLTRGVYKGGESKADLYARLILGIPGTPMPASTTLKPNEVQDVLNYVLSMAEKDKK